MTEAVVFKQPDLLEKLKRPSEKFQWKYSAIRENFVTAISQDQSRQKQQRREDKDSDDFEQASDQELTIEFLSLTPGF